MRRPTLFHCSIFFPLCISSCRACLPHRLPDSSSGDLSQGSNSNLANNNNVLLPSQAAQPNFPIWHALACIWACRAAHASHFIFHFHIPHSPSYLVDPKLLAYRRSGPVPPMSTTPAGGNWIDTLSILPYFEYCLQIGAFIAAVSFSLACATFV